MTSETVAAKSFLGVPVKGDISRTEKRTQQKPLEDLAPLFEAVLSDPLIQSFGWTQYTPYFNDGDPCIFRVNAPYFRTVQDGDESDRWALEIDYGRHPTLGGAETEWKNGLRVEKAYEGDHETTYRACRALNAALQSGSFDDVLQGNFGDHATITVSREGIEVEFYEHD